MKTFCLDCGKVMKEINFTHEQGSPVNDRGFKCVCGNVYKEANVLVKLEKFSGFVVLKEDFSYNKAHLVGKRVKLDAHGMPDE